MFLDGKRWRKENKVKEWKLGYFDSILKTSIFTRVSLEKRENWGIEKF